LVAILPILSVLVLGAEILGAVHARVLRSCLLIGLTSGAYSSIFIASPLLAMLKEHEERYRRIRERLESRGSAMLLISPAAVAAGALSTPEAGTTAKRRRSQGVAASRPATLRPGASRSTPVANEEAVDDGAITGDVAFSAVSTAVPHKVRLVGERPGLRPDSLAPARLRAVLRHGTQEGQAPVAAVYRHSATSRTIPSQVRHHPGLPDDDRYPAGTEHPDLFRRALARKGAAADFDELLGIDVLWRDLTTEVDELRRKTRPRGKPTEEERAALVVLSQELRRPSPSSRSRPSALELLIALPNPPDDSAPTATRTRTLWSCAEWASRPSSGSPLATTWS